MLAEFSYPPLRGGVGAADGGAGARSAEVSSLAFARDPFDLAFATATASPLPRRGRLGEPDRPKYTAMKRARALRKNMTRAEVILWQHLRRKQMLGLPIRRQHPIEPYIADFACRPLKLVIEVDGDTHADAVYDARRTSFMEREGWQVLRVFNVDVFENLNGVLEVIGSRLAELQRFNGPTCDPIRAAKNNVDKEQTREAERTEHD